MPWLITGGQFWSSGVVVACPPVCVRVCVCLNPELVRPIFFLSVREQKCRTPCLRPFLFKVWLTLTLQVKLNLKVKIYPSVSCPCDESPPIEVRISKIGQRMHLSTVKILIDIRLDCSWPWPSFFILEPFFFLPNFVSFHSFALFCI